jgi:hypothetical protein
VCMCVYVCACTSACMCVFLRACMCVCGGGGVFLRAEMWHFILT